MSLNSCCLRKPYIYALLIASAVLGKHSLQAEEGRVRVRAREHYEQLRIKGFEPNVEARYAGLTNSINIWYEVPFHYSIGLTGSPLFASLPLVGKEAPTGTGDRMKLIHLGLETKYFPLPECASAFGRLGIYESTLQTNGTRGVIRGQSILLGLGYEWNLGGIGLAPEMAWRFVELDQGLSARGTAPAIGLHFYRAL